MAYPWFKFYGSEYLSDAKMLSLSAASRSCWITLLAYASIATEPGVVRHMTEEKLMAQAGVSPMDDEWNDTKGVLKRFESLEMIAIDRNTVSILNWEKRQDAYLTDAERQARYRERHGRVTEKSRDDVTKVTLDKNRIDKNRIEEEFIAFWSSYPKKVGKPVARRAFEKAVGKSKPEAIMAGLERWKKSRQWTKDDGDFIPHASTWLNQERWNDEVQESSSKKPDRFIKEAF